MLADLDKRFDDPPRSFSPVPIWWWSGEKLDAQRLRWQLERFAEGGVYNLLIMNLAPGAPLYGSDADDPPYFSEEWWKIFRRVCEDAHALGMHLWFYDQFGFSGANMQARLVTQQPAFAGQSLERIACDVTGTGMLECPETGTPVAAFVVPIDGQGQPVREPSPVSMHGKSVTWQGSGTHRLMLFYSIESGFDYFNVSACQALLAMVHGAFEAHVGDFFGNVIVGTFQDELAAMPTWSRDFAEAFRVRCGYDILAHLPALGEEYGEQAQRVRHDYHATRSALTEAALFKPLFQWHEERGLTCGFDQQGPARAGYPIQSVQFYADYPRTTAGTPPLAAITMARRKSTPRWLTCTTGPACGSRRFTVRAGEARWKKPSTGCCHGYVQVPTSTIPMRCTTALVGGGGSGLPHRRTGDNRTGSTIPCLPRR